MKKKLLAISGTLAIAAIALVFSSCSDINTVVNE